MRPRTATALATMLLLLGLLGQAARAAEPPLTRAPAGSLAAFHSALEALKRGERDLVTILQIGDSHTASDHLSGRIRTRLQAHYGNAGRGLMQPGEPFAYYRPYQVRVTQKGPWQQMSSNRIPPDAGPYGISGVILRGTSSDATIDLQTSTGEPLGALALDFHLQPGGGSIEVRVSGNRVALVPTADAAYRLAHSRITLPRDAAAVTVAPHGDGPVDLAAMGPEPAARGVRLVSMGFSGAQLTILDRWSAENVAFQIRRLAPSLILVAFGTNEGHQSRERLAGYDEAFARRLGVLRAAAPGASVVVVGPPDAERLPRYCMLPVDQADAAPCTVLSEAETLSYDDLLARSDRSLCRWHTPAALPWVRRTQSLAAQRLGIAFWDWSTVMPAVCGANVWWREGLAHRDRVHLTQAGYWRSADALLRFLAPGL